MDGRTVFKLTEDPAPSAPSMPQDDTVIVPDQNKIEQIKTNLTNQLKTVSKANGSLFTHAKLGTIAATLTFKDQKLSHKDVEAIMQDLDAKVIEHLATDLPYLLKFMKLKHEPTSQKDLSHILRALPTLVQIVYHARKLDMPRAQAELEQLHAEEKRNRNEKLTP